MTAHTPLPAPKGERINVRVASSCISYAQAERNLGELGDNDLEARLKSGEAYDYDIQNHYEALLHGANNAGPLDAVGRAGAARRLEYAYDDFAIYRLARALGKPAEKVERYRQRSLNYRKPFDPETKLMRGATLDFELVAEPDLPRGTTPSAYPYSPSTHEQGAEPAPGK